MRFLTAWVLAFGLLWGAAGAAETDVAFVAGRWPHEADAFTPAHGWRLTRYQDTDADRLFGELDRYQVVIWGSLAGYDHKVDWARHSQILHAFVEKGGLFIALDANYASATDDIFGAWGADFPLKRESNCAMAKKAQGDSPKIARQLPLANIPYALADLFDGYTDGWSHFADPPRPWQVLARCPDGAAFAVTRRVGKGGVTALAYALFHRHERQAMLEALAANLLAARNQENERLRIAAFRVSDQYGPGNAEIALTGEVAGVSADVSLNGAVIASQPMAAGKNRIPFLADDTGTLTLALKKGDMPVAAKHVEVVPPVALAVPRYAVYPLIAEAVRLDVTFAREELAADPYRLEFLVDGEAFTAAARERAGVYRADVSALAPGEHGVSVRLLRGDDGEVVFAGAPEALYIMAADPRVALTPKGFLRVDGTPFFPVGLYHVSKDTRIPLEKRDEVLRFAAEHGYNTLHVSVKWEESAASFGAFLREARKRNVMILPESDHLTQSVQRHGGDDALLGWNVGDEPDLEGISPATFHQRMRAFKDADAEALSYTVFMSPGAIARYWPVTDLVAVDPYPVPRYPLAYVHESVASARERMAGTSSGLIAVLQGFGYENDATFAVPTPRQARNMLYQALVAGAQGILFYTYQDGRFYLPDHPALFELMKTVPAELKPLEDFLLNGDYRALPVDRAGVYAAEWKTPDATLTIIVNTTAESVRVALNGEQVHLEPEAVDIRK